MRALIFALVLASGAAAQPASVLGTVQDSTGSPLPGVNVYLSGTTHGDATDAGGRFEIEGVEPGAYRVVASLLGFAPEAEAVSLGRGDTLRVALVLVERPLALGAARVEATRDRRWEKQLAWFSRELLGESARADSTTILNPEVLDFRQRWGTLTATARAPLVIENRALGYRLRYDLLHFEASAGRVSYDGDEIFEPLAPENSVQTEQWRAAREAAYRGSLRHLLRALLTGTAEAEGFSLSQVFSDTHTAGATFRARGSGLMRAEPDGWGMLRFRGRIEATYKREVEEQAYLTSRWFRERRSRPDPLQRSTLYLDGFSARIDPQGTPENPFALSTSGYMAFERLADHVPEDYTAEE